MNILIEHDETAHPRPGQLKPTLRITRMPDGNVQVFVRSAQGRPADIQLTQAEWQKVLSLLTKEELGRG